MSRYSIAIVFFALTLAGLSGSAAGKGMPPLVRATPKAERLPQLSSAARAVVAELDGKRRGNHLFVALVQAQRSGTLLRLALELQSLLHDKRGNYLYALYRVLDARHAETARKWARLLAGMGVAIGITSGHFENLDHLDPEAPVPAAVVSGSAGISMARWVDGFTSARYKPGYRPFQRGFLSEVVQLRYADGTVLDIDIRVISDNRDPALVQALARPYVGEGGRLFPLRLNRDTTPRLWRVKHDKALAGMERSNREFALTAAMGITAVMVNTPLIPAGPGASAATGRVRSARSVRSSSAPTRVTPAAAPRAASKPAPARAQAPVPTHGRIVRRVTPSAALRRTAKPASTSWPPRPPVGRRPAMSATNAASWRYQRYVYRAFRNGKTRDKILPFSTWRRRYFDTVKNGGRPGRPGGPAHQADVARNEAKPNSLRIRSVGNRVPDGVGEYGQTLVIRGQRIKPEGRGRVIVESDHLIRNGTIPNSAARAQVRDIRKADPGATIVVTDQANPKTAPLVYPPGKQPPPPGRLPGNQEPVVPYP